MDYNMEVLNQATKVAGEEGSQGTDTQSANSPKVTTLLEFHQAEEIERLINTVTDLKENDSTSADHSHRHRKKNGKAPQDIQSNK